MTSDAADQAGLELIGDVERARLAWSRARGGDHPVEELIQHLRTRIPYYRGQSGQALAGLPVVDRSLYQDQPEAFRVARSAAPYALTSSGTSGEPLTVTLDESSWYAVNYHFFQQIVRLAGWSAGIFRPGQIAVLFVSNKAGRRSFVRPLPGLNDGLYVRVQLGAAANVVSVYDRMRAEILYGKPTYLLDLRDALRQHGLPRPPWSPRLLLVSGEPLHADDRGRLSDYFSAPVMDAYASTEGGLVAAARPGDGFYQVLSENVLLEVLTGAGTVAAEGTGELVLTNLVYRDTVFARYRTGDRAELVTAADGTQRLTRLWGREPESLSFRTWRLPTGLLTDRLGFLPGVGDFQVVTGPSDDTVVRWALEAGADSAESAGLALRAAVKELLPDEPVIFQQSDRITPQGGKKRRFLWT
jgi:phenylacetate-coenzyme A ligase PaaK-like adenylate-forming protein